MERLQGFVRSRIAPALLSRFYAEIANRARVPVMDDAERNLAVDARKLGGELDAPLEGIIGALPIEEGGNHLRQPARHDLRGAFGRAINIITNDT
jgi:hypothetical protein